MVTLYSRAVVALSLSQSMIRSLQNGMQMSVKFGNTKTLLTIGSYNLMVTLP